MTGGGNIQQIFFEECEELLENLADGLSAMDEGQRDEETLNGIFRAVHSIKGGAGALAFDPLIKFAHEFENVLDALRNGTLEYSGALSPLIWKASDGLNEIVLAARSNTDPNPELFETLLPQLAAFVPENGDEGEPPDFQPLALAFDDLSGETEDGDDGEGDAAPRKYHIAFHPKDSLFHKGGEVAALFRALSKLGVLEVECNQSDMVALRDLEPEQSYLSWSLEITTCQDIQDIHDVFEFAVDDCDLEISEIGSDAVPENPAPMAKAGPAENPEEVVPRIPPEKPAAKAYSATVRVNVDRVDRLINLIGELVVSQAILTQIVQDSGAPQASDIAAGLDNLKHLTRDVQDGVMAIRAQPVKILFQRMARIVREAAGATGKSVQFVTSGEDTEIDKTMIELLGDPLMHMIRNAVDHGLEPTEDRVSHGKSATGTIHLSAAHRSGRVILEVSDDGAGIDRDRVLKSASKKGLVAPSEDLDDDAIDNLIFLPGFSTAGEVSTLSGRGVGMDVVRNAIRSLGGRVTIRSIPTKGTVFSISLPLTLAILDGMVVEVADQRLVIPIAAILETMQPSQTRAHEMRGARVLHVRGEIIPVVDLGLALGYSFTPVPEGQGIYVLVETEHGTARAFLVDAICDQRQVVIKTLKNAYGEVPGISAATILGDGLIALILDSNAEIFQKREEIVPKITAHAAAG